MNYVEIEHLYKSFGEKTLFENISFKIEQGEKTALIAKNGSGKTTLINIILGKELPDNGNIIIRNDIHINYLNQNSELNPEDSVINTIFQSENQFIKCIKNYNKCVIASASHKKEDIENLNKAINLMDSLDAWNYENKIQEILQVFEIPNLNETVSNLSGGQQKRLSIAKVLIDKSDMLFLDEPTNHLDIYMIEWLENYLKKEKITLFIISHDRYFIDNICDNILEIDDHKLYKYKGNYSSFLTKKAERKEIEIKNIEHAQNRYRVELEWMRRQPQARQHKSKKREEYFYDIEKIAKKNIDNKTYKFNVQASRLGKKILEIHNLSKLYGNKKIISDFSYNFLKNDKIGIVGKNGIGKTTFFNLITKKINPDSGKILVGSTIQFGYFGQQNPQFNDDKTILEIVKEYTEQVNIDSKEIGASQFLSKFNFPPSVQHNKFGRLSGGEKRRFYLLLILMQSPNFLILDEPTNDLDIDTLNLLEDFLTKYKGVLIIASHDRLFLDKLAEHVFAFEGNGIIKDYPGNYTDYVEWRKKQNTAIHKYEKQVYKKQNDKIKQQDLPKTHRKISYKEKKEYQEISCKIESLEKEKKTILEKMNDTSTQIDELQKISIRYGEIDDELNSLENRWLELSEMCDN